MRLHGYAGTVGRLLQDPRSGQDERAALPTGTAETGTTRPGATRHGWWVHPRWAVAADEPGPTAPARCTGPGVRRCLVNRPHRRLRSFPRSRPRRNKVDGFTLQLVGCPQCLAPAEITDRFVLQSSSGPVVHITVCCIHRHRFTMSAEHLPSVARRKEPGPRTPAST